MRYVSVDSFQRTSPRGGGGDGGVGVGDGVYVFVVLRRPSSY